MVAVGKDKFYITKFARYRDFMKYNIEMLSGRRYGEIFYYDGHAVQEVASGYYMPNGNNISTDKKVVYVAEWDTISKEHNQQPCGNSAYTGTGTDNVEVDSDTGDLWIGSQPISWKIIISNVPSLSPSQVVRVKMRDNTVSDMDIIYQDGGNGCAGSTVTSFTSGKIGILKD